MTTAGTTPVATGRLATAVLDEIERVVLGKRDTLELILLGVLAGGHVLIEDLPGLGKTLMARSLPASLAWTSRRIQFTPDLMPADITGAPIYDQRSGEFAFRQGPVFTNLLLADEINRTPPKTQAALLEAMQEGQVTRRWRAPSRCRDPFFVLATQNPIEQEGTYPLPEAQLDRFLDAGASRLSQRPRRGEGCCVSTAATASRPQLRPLVRAGGRAGHARVAGSRTGRRRSGASYIVALVDATRHHPKVVVGASPRGAIAVLQLAKAHAVLAGRDFVLPEDVKAVAIPALAHRLALRPEMWVCRITGKDVVTEVLAQVATPPTRKRQ